MLAFLLAAGDLAWAHTVTATQETVRIGVLAYRGKEQAMQRWSPTAEYLSNEIMGQRYQFEIVPVNLDEMAAAIQHGDIDFTLTNPGNYVDLEARFGISRLVTMQRRDHNQTRVRYGAVIVARSDNTSVKTIRDLKGKSFMAVSPQAFGGFQMAWRELKEHGIDPFRDFSELKFTGFPQDAMILAVKNGVVDAATVRAETLARMVESGAVSLEEFRILNAQYLAGSSIPYSTRLYPEWPFATLKSTPRELATLVTQALLSMPTDHIAARTSWTAGWTIPLDYSPVSKLMQELQIGPYEVLRQTSLIAVMQRYAYWIAAAVLVLIGLIFLNGYISRTNRRLKDTERSLRKEIVERERYEAALARYRDTLEELVAERTVDLKVTNFALEKSRVALRELVRITSAPELSHEQKLVRLLETGREYYGLPVAVLASVERGAQRVCKVSGDTRLVPHLSAPLDEMCAARLIERHGEPLDIPNLAQGPNSDLTCLQHGWKSYLGAAVLVDGAVHCTLEFAGTEAREGLLSRWDHELLKVMAQWISDELERQMANESQQRHEAELARVSRMSTMGEMAASLAHELNQPLTGAINYSNGCLRLLRDGVADRHKLMEGMQRAVEGATLAANIIRQIREFVQKGDAQRGLVNLNTAIKNVISLVNLEARRHAITIELDLMPELPLVEGNMIQLEQVILNLVRNGIDSMESVHPSERRMTISTRTKSQSIVITSTDTGEGISEEALPKIFDAFYSTKTDGMGIGLSISRSIVESHHGRIQVRSQAGCGAEFSFELPIAQAA